MAGCGSVWLERLVWDQEVAGSNPVTPINILCASGSGVEHHLAKVGAAGSNPVSRSFYFPGDSDPSESPFYFDLRIRRPGKFPHSTFPRNEKTLDFLRML